MEVIHLIFFMGVFFGLFMTLVWHFLETRVLFRKVKIEARHILEESQEKAEDFLNLNKKECEKKNENKLLIFEKEKDLLNSKLQVLEESRDKQKRELQNYIKTFNHQIHNKQDQFKFLKKEKKRTFDQKQHIQTSLKEYQSKRKELLKQKVSIELELIKKELNQELKEEWRDYIKTHFINIEDRQALQKSALFYLNLALTRFQRKYCFERGIPSVKFKDKEHLEKALGKDKVYLEQLEKECGVDVVINEENFYISVFGIDPVRREWGRLSLEKLFSRNTRVNFSTFKKIIRLSKQNLFSKIKNDGMKICKRLKLKNIAPEVQNMLGALRYRYSFAQNQHFHCEEVGWLCGLLNAEMDLPTKVAQKSGLFHDIGKAMDHSIEGSHAVIGAEFLTPYEKDSKVIHAVKAHHYDEAPSTALAFLVIVADSISGSRPGARRFTEDSYNQKIASLEKIIKSFEHIDDFYIMNAGREIRVIVDPEKVTDGDVILLSQNIAKEVEKECSYPGLIKVSVVRRSEVSASA